MGIVIPNGQAKEIPPQMAVARRAFFHLSKLLRREISLKIEVRIDLFDNAALRLRNVTNESR